MFTVSFSNNPPAIPVSPEISHFVYFLLFYNKQSDKATKTQDVTECESVCEEKYYAERTIITQVSKRQIIMIDIAFQFWEIKAEWNVRRRKISRSVKYERKSC